MNPVVERMDPGMLRRLRAKYTDEQIDAMCEQRRRYDAGLDPFATEDERKREAEGEGK